METEGPVAHAVLGCLCWFSPCLLETALASSFVYSRWRESSVMVNIAALHIPFCSTSCASDRLEFSVWESRGSTDCLLAQRAVRRPGQLSFCWWRKVIEKFLIIAPCYALGKWHLNAVLGSKPLTCSFLILIE